jgi:ABC-type antimicrobial peptide transport system permease subunit
MVAASLASDRFSTFLLVAFAVAALLLAAVGIYGVFAGDVTHRRKEIGIRLALGAHASQVVALLLARAATRAAAGIVLGTGVALAFAQAMKSLLFGVRSSDPLSYVLVAGLVMALAVGATLIPAIGAARSAPLSALREN